MMADVYVNSVFRFKRGSAADWTEQNPVLLSGEPGFEKDTSRLKVGDGVHAWNDLTYIGETEGDNFTAETPEQFPQTGIPGLIYFAESTNGFYYWNADTAQYEDLFQAGGEVSYDIIYGGNAYGTA